MTEFISHYLNERLQFSKQNYCYNIVIFLLNS